MCGILLGLSLGYLRSDTYSGLPVGLIIALLFIFGGAMSRWQKQKFTELEHWNKKRSKK
jgi:F0F1-type ATP synthase assembly protein I